MILIIDLLIHQKLGVSFEMNWRQYENLEWTEEINGYSAQIRIDSSETWHFRAIMQLD